MRVIATRIPFLLAGGLVFSAVLASPQTAVARPRFDPGARSVPAGVESVQTREDHFGDGTTILRHEQVHRGLPVIGHGYSVLVGKAGRVRGTLLDTVDVPVGTATTPTLSAVDAAGRAQEVLNRATGVARFAQAGANDAHLVMFVDRFDHATRLAWAVVPRVPVGLPTAPRVLVDALSGRILEARDLVVFAESARVYETNPIASPTLGFRDLPMPTTDGTGLSNAFLESHNCIDKKAVKAIDVFGLSLSVRVCDLVQTASRDSNATFSFEPMDDPRKAESMDDAFSEVSMYYHAAKAYSYFRTLQGDPAAQVVADRPLRTISNLRIAKGLMQGNLAAAGNPNEPLEPFSNAFFSPASGGLGQVFQQLYGFDAGAMWFGQGAKRDYSYDGDVVYHEFTHAVVDASLKLESVTFDEQGLSVAPGAMNEGLADYFSAAISGDPKIGEYAVTDLLPGVGAIRELDNQDGCPNAITGEVHFDSTLFSGALWEARMSLPQGQRVAFDAAVYKTMRLNPGSGDGYEDVAELIKTVLASDLPEGATKLDEVMRRRGILPRCSRQLRTSGEPVAAPKGAAAVGAFLAPGKGSLGVPFSVVPGIIQVAYALPAGALAVHVKFRGSVARGAPGGLGGGNGEYKPVVLAKFDAPIRWTLNGRQLTSDADISVAPTKDGSTYELELEVPEGAAELVLQIANEGDADGGYNDITLEATAAAIPEGPATEAAPAPRGGTQTEVVTTGCGCVAVGRAPRLPAWSMLIGLLALPFARRRARSR